MPRAGAQFVCERCNFSQWVEDQADWSDERSAVATRVRRQVNCVGDSALRQTPDRSGVRPTLGESMNLSTLLFGRQSVGGQPCELSASSPEPFVLGL